MITLASQSFFKYHVQKNLLGLIENHFLKRGYYAGNACLSLIDFSDFEAVFADQFDSIRFSSVNSITRRLLIMRFAEFI